MIPVPGADVMTAPLAAELRAIVAAEPVDLSQAALVIARIEYPSLDVAATVS